MRAVMMALAVMAGVAAVGARQLAQSSVPVTWELLQRTGVDFPGSKNDPLTPGLLTNKNNQPIYTEKSVAAGKPVLDYSENPDFGSLIPTGTPNQYYWVQQFEASQPSPIYVQTVTQDKATGKFTVTKSERVDSTAWGGSWVLCAGQLSPWNTHLGGEEYEPDARVLATATSLDGNESTSLKNGLDQWYNLGPFMRYYGYYQNNLTLDAIRANFNPYKYGHTVEVKVGSDGKPSYTKWYTTGRVAQEMAYVMPDNRTVYVTDDGTNVGFFKLVTDKAGDLSSGTLYALKVKQLSDKDGGEFETSWIKLGSATQKELVDIVNGGIKFADIFEYSKPANGTCPEGYKPVNAGPSLQECLKLKPGQDKWAAFLETRRFAAYQGATTEFSKWEGITYSPKEKKIYTAMADVRYGMEDNKSKAKNETKYDIGGSNDVRLPYNPCGCVYAIDVTADYNTGKMKALVCGNTKSDTDEKNSCSTKSIASPDNVAVADDLGTLFIGEDTDGHQTDFVWAYDLKTGSLTRIFTAVPGSETTSVYYYPNLNGFSYVINNIQHPYGESDQDLAKNATSQGLPGYLGYFVWKATDAAGRKVTFAEVPVPTTAATKDVPQFTKSFTIA